MRILFKIFTSTVAVFVAGYVIPGVKIDSWVTAMVFAIALGVLNMVLKPILSILAFPITVLTFGLFSLVLNALMVLLAASLVPGVAVSSLLSALGFSIVISIISSFLNSLGA